VSDIQRESQAVLDRRTMTSTVLLKHGKNDGIAVYVPKETILKEMAAKIKLSQHFSFDIVRELSDTPHKNAIKLQLISTHLYPIRFLKRH
jgi:hypothetical protein